MSDSDRDGNSPLRLRRWLIPAAIFAAVMVGYGGLQHGIYYYEAARHDAGHARNAHNQIATECGMPTAPENCEHAIDDAAREDRRDEYDLYSQKAMALWTAIMGAMAVIGVSLSGVGVYLIWRTWDATQKAANNSLRTLNSYIAKERAHLRVAKAFATFGGNALDPTPGFTISFTNLGLSAGIIQNVAFRYSDETKWDPVGFAENSASVFIPAGGSGNTPQLSIGEFRDRCLTGYARYTTLEGLTFKTYFCFSINLVKGGGYGPDVWEAEAFRPPGMPDDT